MKISNVRETIKNWLAAGLALDVALLFGLGLMWSGLEELKPGVGDAVAGAAVAILALLRGRLGLDEFE